MHNMAQSKRGVASVLLLATSTVVAGEACAATCFGASCDHWDGGAWGTCAHLEVTQGCDCSGCACDGCPQASCEAPRFDPIACPSAGDGRCDPHLNVEACAWDGGDCCASTCLGTCVVQFNCLDPDQLERAPSASPTAEKRGTRFGVNGGLAVVILFIVFTFATYYMRHRRSDHLLRAIHRATKERPVGDGDAAAAAAMVATLSRDVSSAKFASAECPICLYELCDGEHGREEAGLDDDAVVLPCAHAFHGRCVRPWFALAYADALRAGGEAPSLACPVCRAVVESAEPEV